MIILLFSEPILTISSLLKQANVSRNTLNNSSISKQLKITKKQFTQQYQFIETIGRGSSGSDHTILAVKIINADSKEQFEDIKTELQALLILKSSENIVKLIKWVEYEEDQHLFQLYIIMPLADQTLHQKILDQIQIKSRFTEDQLMILLKQIVNALYEAESKNIAHRDVKPQNILIFQNKYCLSDFGIARYYENIAQTMMTTINFQGSISFMAPEVLKLGMGGDHSFSFQNFSVQDGLQFYHKCDVFSLGLTILYTALLKPITDCNKDANILKKRLDDLKDLDCYSSDLVNLIHSMLQWENYQRPNFTQLNHKIDKLNNEKFGSVNDQQSIKSDDD